MRTVLGKDHSTPARDRAAFQEPLFAPLHRAVLAAIPVGPGMAVLDIGCGAGLFLQLIAGHGAATAGLDPDQGSINLARARVMPAELRTGPLDSTPFPDGRFDLVTCLTALPFAADPAAIVREAKRVTKPGGRIAVAAWSPDPADRSAIILRPFTAPAAHQPEALDSWLAGSDLAVEQAVTVALPFLYGTLNAAVRALLAQGDGTVEMGEALGTALSAFQRPDGTILLRQTARLLIARRDVSRHVPATA